MKHWIVKGPLSSSGAHGEVTSIIPMRAGVAGVGTKIVAEKDGSNRETTLPCLIIRKAQKFRTSQSSFMTLLGKSFLFHFFS